MRPTAAREALTYFPFSRQGIGQSPGFTIPFLGDNHESPITNEVLIGLPILLFGRQLKPIGKARDLADLP